MAQPGDLRQTFAETLSPNIDIRRNAENRLKQGTLTAGHPLQVLHLIASSNAADAAVRQAAAVHFKNIVKNGWDENREDGTNGIVVSPQDRNTIKSHLVELMCTVPHQIQAQISESIALIAAVDYPKNWDDLLPKLVQQFNSTDLNVLNGVLKTANSIFKSFRYVGRSDALYNVILYTLDKIQEPLLTLFVSMGQAVEAYPNDPAQLKPRFEALRTICRIYYSLMYQDLPEYFEDHMGQWMGEFAKYLQYKNPVLSDADEELEPSPIDTLQAAIVENLSHFAGNDEETFVEYLPNFTTLIWNNLMGLTTFSKHDTLVTKSIKFLSSLVAKQMHRDIFKDEATLRQIMTLIVIPNLMIREVDEERFEDDPQDFILTEVEGNDSESRRRNSQELLRAMCRQFEAETTAICSEHVNSMLSEFSADNSKWKAKDAATQLMFGISIRAESHKGVSETNPAVNVMDFFTTHIFPELQDFNHNNRPMVKATALKFVCTFRNQFSREQLVALMPLLIKHFSSPIVVVHTFAAYAIERILFTKETEAAGAKRHKISGVELQPFLEPLFTGLFNIVDNTEWNENEHVMKCVMRSLATAGADVIPITGIVFGKLATALERVCKNPRNPMFNHYLFESIAVLVRNVCSRDPSQTGQLEVLLFPPFQTILQMEIVEFTPYVFQVLAQLLEYRPAGAGLGDAYTMLFPPLLTPGLWERKGNIPALVRLIQAYLKKAARELAEQGHLVGILGVFQKLISSKANESSAFELLSAITMYVSREAVNSYLNTIFQILLMRLQHAKSARYTKLITNFFALLAGKYGAQVFFDSTNQIQAGLALNLLVQVWVPRLQTDPPLRLDAKTQVVGLTRLLCDTPALLSDANGKQIWAQALAAVVTMVTSPSWSVLAGDDDDQEVEIIGYDATYSGLTFARKALDDPFADIADPIATFVQSLHSLSTSQPGVITPIIQQGLGSDPKLSSGLQNMFQKAGLHLA